MNRDSTDCFELDMMKMKSDNVPTESYEQRTLIEWAALNEYRLPELRLLYAVPNGGARRKSEAARMRLEGVKSGVPDLCLPVSRDGYHGLYIEMKRIDGGRKSKEQKQWISDLIGQGYRAEFCNGWEKAAELIEEYMTGEKYVNSDA